jgi:hypothetical protein
MAYEQNKVDHEIDEPNVAGAVADGSELARFSGVADPAGVSRIIQQFVEYSHDPADDLSGYPDEQ